MLLALCDCYFKVLQMFVFLYAGLTWNKRKRKNLKLMRSFGNCC